MTTPDLTAELFAEVGPAGLLSDLDLTRRTWLVSALRELRVALLNDALWPQGPEDQDALAVPAELTVWAQTRLTALNTLLDGPDVTSEGDASAGVGRRWLLNGVGISARVALEAARRAAGSMTHPSLVTAAAIGIAAGVPDAAQKLYALRQRMLAGEPLEEGVIAREIQEPAKAVAAALERGHLADDHPLVGRGFHRLLVRHDAIGAARAADLLVRDDATPEAIAQLSEQLGWERAHYVGAITALVWADGKESRVERRLLDELRRLAGVPVPPPGDHMIQPPTPAELAEGIVDPGARKLVVGEVILAAAVDGSLDPGEQRFIAKLGAAFGFDDAAMLAIHQRIGRHLTDASRLNEGLGWRAALARLGKRTETRIQSLVSRNLHAIYAEAKETGDLMALLAKATTGPLSADEDARMKQQIRDLCRAVPALALFAAPGGTILLPMLARVLPFSLAPSAFEEPAETFGDE